MQLKQRKCGCENNDCVADPNEVTTPDTVPMYSMDSIPGHTIPSVAYPDLGEFLFQYYERVNTHWKKSWIYTCSTYVAHVYQIS